MPRTRSAAIGAAVVVAVLIVTALALPRLFDVNAYRPQVQAAIATRLHREVALGRMHLSFIPLGLTIDDAVIADDPEFETSRPFVRADQLYVRLDPVALLHRRLNIQSLELRAPVIELLRDSTGRWNVSTLGGGTREKAPRLALRHFSMSEGEVAVTAPESNRTIYRHIDIQLDDYSPERAFDVTLAATLPGDGAQRLTLKGTAGPLVLDPLAMTPFDGHVQFDVVSLTGLQRFFTLKGLAGTEAVISGTADLTNRDERLASRGELRFEHVRTHGLDVGYPIAAAFDLTHDSRTRLLTIKSGKFRLDQTPLSVDGTVNLKPETPDLTLHLLASDVSMAEAARLASAFDLAFAKDTQVQGRLTTAVTLRGPIRNPALDGRLQLRDVSISGAHIPRPVHTPAVDLALSPQEIRSNDFSASTNGTSLGMRVAVRDYTTATPLLDVTVRTADADLGDMLSVARAWGIHAAEGVSGSGRVTLALHAAGPRDALKYTGSGALRGATLQTPSLAQPLRVTHADLTFDNDAAMVEKLAASIGKTHAEGSITVRSFTTPSVTFQLTADRIDVADMQTTLAPARALQQRSGRGESMLLRTTGSGRLRIGTLTYGNLVMDDVQATATADRGLIRLQPLTAALFGGRHRGFLVVDARRTPATFALNSDLERVDANRLVTAIVDRRDVIVGVLASTLRMNVSAGDTQHIARSLNGTMSLNLPDGRIPNVQLLHEVADIARFITASPATVDRSTRVTAVSGTFAVTNGVANTNNLTASIEGGTVGATGSINLVDQQLNLRVTTVLSPNFSRHVGGTQIGGFMTTALANSNGELVVPVLVTGTMQQPRFAPDVQRIAEMKLRQLTPSLQDPQRMATAILRGVLVSQTGDRTSRQTVDDIVGAVTGRSKANPPRQDDDSDQPQTPPEPPTASRPERKDPAQEIRDALEGLLGRRKSREP